MTYTALGTVQTRAARVVWMLEELGVPYDYQPARPRSEEALRATPAGKVPVLIVDGVVLTDSTAILTYLTDKHGQFTYGAGSLERALQDGFTGLILDELEGLLWAASRHGFILPEEMRVAALKPSLKWEFERNLTRLEQRFVGPFLMGAQMTVPDILLAHCLGWAGAAKFPAPGPLLAAFHGRMTARPAYQRTMAR